MTNAYRAALSAVDEYRRTLYSWPVIYWRAGAAIPLDAMPARSRIMAMSAGDAVYESMYKDFIVASCDLIAHGRRFRPSPGDIIEAGNDRWEILPEADACWSPCEPTETFIRIHTRRLKR
ncbi:MAG TPA: hypothetical protein PLK04_10170 [Bacillota bacterium]|nr:hypothetical protein [Bacillota bacterium]HPZ14587.1 hypothetical protein [Bacillota bacterium]